MLKMKNKKPIIQRMKRSVFISRLNSNIKEFGANVKLIEEKLGADIIQITMDGEFTQIPLSEDNYNQHYLEFMKQEVINKKMRNNKGVN